ncbi:MAG TPA: phosphate acyltransferase PlsX [Rhabdochlamydiaceae bacterium]|jgi:glycerol-3-phosphate acyltransferase PlsX|nr:phosphate acyltransferase PlsX [Rhabdochlamydiaceae bacterium]
MKLRNHRIGIDLMGFDTAPEAIYQAVLQLLQDGFPAQIVFFASQEVSGELDSSLEIVSCSQVIQMDDDPLVAVRRKKDSSLCQGLKYLKEEKIDAFVSAGSTGALLLSAKTTLKTLRGIDRPAMLALLPTKKKEVAVLDVGANLTLKPHHIVQFAAMGIAYQKSRGIASPTVGLLNIGTEAKKGTPQLQEAYLKLDALNREEKFFAGNIEGKDVFDGNIDVLVTDGFTGNVFLKTAEGLAAFILEQIEQTSCTGSFSHLTHELAALRSRLHYTEYPGAILCGVNGVVVKCHGDSSPETFLHGIKGALRLVEHRFLEKIKSQLSVTTY